MPKEPLLDPYEQLASQTLQALRNSRSQLMLSRRLGYKANVVHTWERGRRWPTAARVFEVVRRLGGDPSRRVEEIFPGSGPLMRAHPPDTAAGVAALLELVRGATPIGELATRAGFSRFAVSRWLKGTAEPRLPDFLRLLDAATGRFPELPGLWTDPRGVRLVAADFQALERARVSGQTHPWAAAVRLCLELEGYRALPRHDSAWIAARLGLSEREVEDSLAHLRSAREIHPVGAHFVPNHVHTVDTRPASGRSRAKAHWAKVAEARHTDDGAASSYNLFAVSEADLEKIRLLQRDYFRAVRAIVAQSSPAERVALAWWEILPLDQQPAASSAGPASSPPDPTA